MMNREIAETLMSQLLAMSDPLNRATELSQKIVEKDEREQFRKGIGEIMNIIYLQLMNPIIKQYPDLDPDN